MCTVHDLFGSKYCLKRRTCSGPLNSIISMSYCAVTATDIFSCLFHPILTEMQMQSGMKQNSFEDSVGPTKPLLMQWE